jgi:hypothetical protein
MFEGNTVDCTSSYVPAATPTTEVHEVTSNDEGGEDEDNVTPLSLGTKRASNTSTTATSPNKKTKIPVVRVMNQHMTSHIEIARERLEMQKTIFQQKAQEKENARSGINWKIAECSRRAEHELGISRDTPTLLDRLLALAENEAQMDLFLTSFGVSKMKWRMLQKIPPYAPHKQSKIIVVCMALHNFMKSSGIPDKHFYRCDSNENYVLRQVYENQPPPEVVEDGANPMAIFRDSLAHAMATGS